MAPTSDVIYSNLNSDLIVKVLYNIKSALKFSEEFDIFIKDWNKNNGKTRDTLKHSNELKERLNIDEIYWLLGKDNVNFEINNYEDLQNNKEPIEIVNQKGKAGHALKKEDSDVFEIPDTFLGMDLNMFKNSNFKKKSQPEDTTETKKNLFGFEHLFSPEEDPNELLLDMIYENKEKYKHNQNNRDHVEKFPMEGIFDGLKNFPELNIKEQINEKDELKKEGNGKLYNNFENVKAEKDEDIRATGKKAKYQNNAAHQGAESIFGTSSEDMRLFLKDLDRKERNSRNNNTPKEKTVDNIKDGVVYIHPEKKSTGEIIADLLSQVKKLNLKLGSLSDLGLNVFNGLKIPTLDDVLPEKNENDKNVEDKSEDNAQKIKKEEEDADVKKIINNGKTEDNRNEILKEDGDEEDEDDHDEL